MTLARGCASTAWVFSILSSDNRAVLAFPEQMQEEVRGTDTYATLAGNTNLNPKARAEKVPDGYRLTGQWGFCSGSDFSERLIFNAPAGEEGDGHMFLVPCGDARQIDDWFPTGMRGTGSRTMAVRRCSSLTTGSRRPVTRCRSCRNAARCTPHSTPCTRTGRPMAGSRSRPPPSGAPGAPLST